MPNQFEKIVAEFREDDLTNETIWRSIILFGKNTASYKFSLAKGILDLAKQGKSVVSYEELAQAYAPHLLEHYESGLSQDTRSTDSALARKYKGFVKGDITYDELISFTAKNGFNNVVPRFHNVKGGLPFEFYDYNESAKQLILSDRLYELQSHSGLLLETEVEARWNLVETAWNVGVPVNLLEVKIDDSGNELYIEGVDYRTSVTAARDALSGYQKGKCFYSKRRIDITNIDVDHFFPVSKQLLHGESNLNGVWNLVLAESSINRSKSDKRADEYYLAKLYERNEFYIASRHPLGETIAKQTGSTPERRLHFLKEHNKAAKQYSPIGWKVDPNELS
jgi:5-methylcytosine-specific restriction endonuclease McrA